MSAREYSLKDMQILYRYKASLLHVVDGDTLDVQIDMGFRCSCVQRIRLLGINTPELNSKIKKEREEAESFRVWLRDILKGAKLIIETSKDDSFGRWLAEIYVVTERDSFWHVNEYMVEVLGVPRYERKKK